MTDRSVRLVLTPDRTTVSRSLRRTSLVSRGTATVASKPMPTETPATAM